MMKKVIIAMGCVGLLGFTGLAVAKADTVIKPVVSAVQAKTYVQLVADEDNGMNQDQSTTNNNDNQSTDTNNNQEPSKANGQSDQQQKPMDQMNDSALEPSHDSAADADNQ